ncbi:MAG: DUF5947 family protein [Streptosporangiaceae bacterium]
MSPPSGLRRFVGPPGAAPARPAPAAAAPAGPVTPAPGASVPAAAPAPVASALAGPARDGQDEAEERCEFCATGIPPTHGHVADLEQSSLVCACRACYLLFSQSAGPPLGSSPALRSPGGLPPEPPGASPGPEGTPPRGGAPRRGSARYRSVPDRYLRDSSRPLAPAEWDELQIPVGLAFFLYSTERGAVAGFYPSPAGATECTLDLGAWERLAAAHPLLATAEPDVEAVLLRRDGPGAEVEHFIVPIDVCYELVGRMRMLWKGFDGGSEARASIDEFLAGVRKRAREAPASVAAQQDAGHG